MFGKIRKRDRNNLYLKIFRALLITVVLFVCAVSMMLYYAYKDTTLSLINTYSQESLSKTSYSAELMNEYAKMLALQILKDRNISNLFYISPTIEELNISLKRMNSYLYVSSQIQSIYVYSGHSGNIYSTVDNEWPYDKSSFFDQDIFGILKNMKSSQILRPIARNIKMPNRKTDNYVFTFILPEWQNTPTLQNNIVILNISEEWMREKVHTLGENTSVDTIIIDNSGTTMINSSLFTPLTDISGKNYIQKILNSDKPSGYFTQDVDGEQTLIAYETSNLYDWKFISVIPYSSVTKKTENIAMITLGIGLSLLAAGLLISLILSRKLYKPISAMISSLKKLESEQKKSLYTLKEEFMRSILLSRTDYCPEDIEENFVQLKLACRHDLDFSLILLKIDHFQEFCSRYNASERSMVRFALGNIATGLASRYFNCDFTDMETDHIALLYNPMEMNAGQREEILGEFVESIRTEAKKELDVSLSVVVADDLAMINKIGALYNRALNASYYRLFKGHGCLIYAGQIEELSADGYTYPMSKEKQLTNSLILGKMDDAKETYQQIIENSVGYSYSTRMLTIQRIAFSINSAMDLLEKTDGLHASFSFNSFISSLNTLETLEDINQRFNELFADIIAQQKERKKNKHDAIFSEIIKIINQDYNNPALSIETIAPMAGMSSTYLGRLFKKATSKSISEYLTEIRIEKAKELLVNSTLSVGAISEKVGFINSSYFFTIFKKATGITPSEYKTKQSGVVSGKT